MPRGKPPLVSHRRFLVNTTGGGEHVSAKLPRVPTAAVALKTLLAKTIKRHGEFAGGSLSRTLHLPPTHSSPLLSPTGTSTPRERAREVFRTPLRPRRAFRRSGVEIQHPRPAAKRDAGSWTRRARRRDGAVRGGTRGSGRANASFVTFVSIRTACWLGTASRDRERARFRKRVTPVAARRRRRQRECRRRARAPPRRTRGGEVRAATARAHVPSSPFWKRARARAVVVARDGPPRRVTRVPPHLKSLVCLSFRALLVRRSKTNAGLPVQRRCAPVGFRRFVFARSLARRMRP